MYVTISQYLNGKYFIDALGSSNTYKNLLKLIFWHTTLCYTIHNVYTTFRDIRNIQYYTNYNNFHRTVLSCWWKVMLNMDHKKTMHMYSHRWKSIIIMTLYSRVCCGYLCISFFLSISSISSFEHLKSLYHKTFFLQTWK